MTDEVDMVNHPPHYNSSSAVCSRCGTTIECIDVVRHLPFNIGSAMKYLWRHRWKGDQIMDLQKALFYIKDEIHKINIETLNNNKP